MKRSGDPSEFNRPGWALAAAGLCAAMLALDALTSTPHGQGALYAAPVLVSVRSGRPRLVLLIGGLAAVCVALGGVPALSAADGRGVIADRAAALAMLAAMTAMGVGFLRRNAWLAAESRAAAAQAKRARRSARLESEAGRLGAFGGWRMDVDVGLMLASGPVATLFGRAQGPAPTLEETLSMVAPEHRDRARDAIAACLKTGESFDIEVDLIDPEGRRRIVRALGEAERRPDGGVSGIQGAIQDVTPLRRAEAESRLLKDRLNTALDLMSDAFALVGNDGALIYLNTEAERLLDVRRESLVGRDAAEALPRIAEGELGEGLRRAARSGAPTSFRYRSKTLERWFEAHVHPSRVGLAVFLRDIEVEHAREEHLRLLEAAVARINDIVLITDAVSVERPHPRILWVNEAFERHTGYPASEAIGATPRLLQGPDTPRAELDRIRDALARRTPVRAELVNYRKDGEPFWQELDIVPLSDGAGNTTHFVSVQREVTARKRADAALAASEERFRLLASATEDAVWDWDMLRDSLWWNEKIETGFGLDRARMGEGLARWSERIHPEDLDRVLRRLYALIDMPGEDLWRDEYRFRTGEERYVEVRGRGRVVRDSGGRSVRMLGSMHDISAQREAERQLAAAQRMEAVGRLGGGVAHDFNNLFAVVLGNAELLSQRLADDPKLSRLARITQEAAERGAVLTDRLLAFARRQPLRPQAADVNALLSEMAPLLRSLFDSRIELVFDLDAELPEVMVDPAQLETAMINLCLNARDALPEGGRVDIGARAATEAELRPSEAEAAGEADGPGPGGPRRGVVVYVSENGVGMEAPVLERAFEPFFTTKAVGAGSGLGLSMVYGFARQSGGHARLRSAPGQGTQVELCLPCVEMLEGMAEGRIPAPAAIPEAFLERARGDALLAAPGDGAAEAEGRAEKPGAPGPRTPSRARGAAPAAPAPVPDPAPDPAPGGRVLVVEDDAMVREHALTLLADLGWRSAAAGDGDEALEILRADRGFDLMFTDLAMPGRLSGMQLAERAAELAPEMPVLFTSGYAAQSNVDPARLLAKPYRRAELARKLAELAPARTPSSAE